jgi:hypothetical protein
MSLAVDEFLSRLLEHVPPRGLHTVRGYGLYAGNQRQGWDVARQWLGHMPWDESPQAPPAWQELCAAMGNVEAGHCPVCGSRLVVDSYFKPGRGPPYSEVARAEIGGAA